MLVGARKEMPTVREADLATQLDRDLFESLQTLLENVHHTHLVGKADHHVEARRVEGKRVSLILEDLANI